MPTRGEKFILGMLLGPTWKKWKQINVTILEPCNLGQKLVHPDVRYSNLPGGGTQKQASRVRETHTFKTLHFPASVSSTRDAHFQNQVSSRLRETLLFLKICCLVYAKPPLWEATLSRVHASPALLSQLEHGKSRVSCTRNVCLQKVL